MIDLSNEPLLDFASAASFLPEGSRPAYATWYRWWRHGTGPRRVKLETVLVGGRRYTSEAAMRRFIDALSAPSCAEAAPSSSRSRDREVQVAEKALADWGI